MNDNHCDACGNKLTKLEKNIMRKAGRCICVRCRQLEVDLGNGAIELHDAPAMFRWWFEGERERRGQR